MFSQVGLHESFFIQFPNRQALNQVHESYLPHVPSCPGPYLLPDERALPRPKPSTSFISQFPIEANWYTTVVNQGKPNYRGARLPISKLPLHVWREKLCNYNDWQLTAFMRYGWPMGYEGSQPPDLWQDNHGSATKQPDHVSKYIDKEASLKALAGPFEEPPFEWFGSIPWWPGKRRTQGRIE